MPLSIGASQQTMPEQTPAGELQVWSEDAGSLEATWTDPDGNLWQLTNPGDEIGWFTAAGLAGWGATPIEIITDPLARGGEEVRFIRAHPRRLTWPLHIFGETHLEFVRRYRNLLGAFARTTYRQAPGILRVARPDGWQAAREIACFYEDGFGGDAGDGWLSASPVLTLMCPDGYWRATEPIVSQYRYTTGRPFLNPYPSLSSSRVLGDVTIVNPGDIDAWPTWVITGPATAFTATNPQAGGGFTIVYPLGVGEMITITTDRPTIRGPGDSNLAGALNWPGAMLWPVLSGANHVTLEVAGADDGTSVVLSFQPRYETA